LALNQHYQPTANAPVFDMPDGWMATTLRAVDVPQRVLAQRSAFKSTIMTEERYNFSRSLPSYTPNWDMVAVNDAGEIGAFCTVWVDDWSNYALFEPVGCRQEYQRTGLTRALISTTLQRLATAGITHASVMSDGNPDNPARFFYAACGFQFVDRFAVWLRSGTTLPQISV
jgi:predicted N-acetyltransferase YhbS